MKTTKVFFRVIFVIYGVKYSCNLSYIYATECFHFCTAKLYKAMLNECVEWEAVDITNVLDITKYIPDAVKKVT